MSGAKTDYGLMREQLRSLLETEPYWLPALSNASALIMENLENINWAGFYLVDGGSLVLGPFQGKVACIRIGQGRGVCGTAWQERRRINVPDVHRFPGHIACDAASASELVIPLYAGGDHAGPVAGVLDIDAPVPERFSAEDEEGLAALAALLEEMIDWRGEPWRDQHLEES